MSIAPPAEGKSLLSYPPYLFRLALDSLILPLAMSDLEGNLTFVNKSFLHLWGYDNPAELLGKPIWCFCKFPKTTEAVLKNLQAEGSWCGTLQALKKNGSLFQVELFASLAKDPWGKPLFVVSTFVDGANRRNNPEDNEPPYHELVEALQESEKRYQHLARHDLLTNLPNRVQLLDRLHQAVESRQYTCRPLAIFFADLDRFKQINDSLGNVFGDMVLCEMVGRIKPMLGKRDILARLNSDEFVLVCEELGGEDNLCQLAGRLVEIFKRPLSVSGHTFHLSASIGVAQLQQGEQDAETLLRQAYIAMNEGKRRGGNCYQLFSREMQIRREETFQLEKTMREALEKGEFYLYYQPQIDLVTGSIASVEALARWGKTPKEWVSPEVFIKVAETSGLIHQLGDYVLEEACAQNLRWQQKGMVPIPVTVNISAKQFAHPEFVNKVFCILEKTGLEPRWLELEITESTIMDNVDDAIAIIKSLQAAGVCFAIDDFGTGYSSLNYLRQLPVSKLKIDRSFMAGVPGDRDNEKLVASILALARSFNLQPVAEGIETDLQLAYLRQLCCRFGQGFLFSRPVPPDMIEKLAQGPLI